MVPIVPIINFLSSSRLMESSYLRSRFPMLALMMILLFGVVISNYILFPIVNLEYIGQIISVSLFLVSFILLFLMLFQEKHISL